jgi:hypothetical protein
MRTRLSGRNNTVTINVQNSDQIADLLESAEQTRANGKVVMKATRRAAATAQGRGGAARGIFQNPADGTNSRRRDHAENRPTDAIHLRDGGLR